MKRVLMGILPVVVMAAPLSVPQTTSTIRRVRVYSEEQAVVGIGVELYKEGEFTTILETDEQGEIVVEDEEVTDVRIATTPGYYPDEAFYVCEEGVEIEIRRIHVYVETVCEEDFTAVYVLENADGEELSKFEAKNGRKEIPYRFSVNETYALKGSTEKEGILIPEDAMFTISEEEETVVTETFRKGSIVTFTAPENTVISLYEDAAMEHPLTDKGGKQMRITIGREGKETCTISKGKLFYKIEAVGEEWLPSEGVFSKILQEDREEIRIDLSRVKLKVNGAEGFTVIVKDGETEWYSGKTENEIPILRNHTYCISLTERNGYYASPVQTVTIPEDSKELTTVSFDPVPVRIRIRVKDDATGEYRMNDTVFCKGSAYTVTEETYAEGLNPNETVTFSMGNLPEGIFPQGSEMFTVPTEPSLTEVTLHVRSYLPISFGMEEASGTYGLFWDADGTLPVSDRDGNEVRFTKGYRTVLLERGLYYLKETECAQGYYPQKEAVRIVLQDTASIVIPVRPAEAEFSLTDENGRPLEGTFLLRRIATGEEIDMHETLVKGLIPGESYEVKAIPSSSSYRSLLSRHFTMPDYAEEPVKVALKAKSCTTVSLTYPCAAEVTFFADEACTHRVQDLYGADASGRTENGKIVKELPFGTYYVVSKPLDSSRYPQAVLTSIEADQGANVCQEIDFSPVVLRVQRCDTDGNTIIGSQLEARDSEGNLLDSWVSEEIPHVLSGNLYGGMEILIHETATAEGSTAMADVRCTVPENYNDAYILHLFSYPDETKKNERVIPILEPEPMPETKEGIGYLPYLLTAAGALVVSLCKKLH